MIKLNSSVRATFLGVAALSLGACATTEETKAPPTQSRPVQEAQQAQPTPSEPTRSSGGGMTYNVVRGDHLWGIASKPSIYGNPYQWPLIYKANSSKINDADLILPGQVFTIETSPSGSDVDAAVRHAKSRGAWSIGAIEDSDKRYLSR